MIITAVIAFLASTASLAFAGGKGSGTEDWAAKKLNKLTTNLELSEEQVAKVKALIEVKKSKKQALHEEFKSGLAAILTAEQLEKHETMKAEHKGSKGHHEHGGSSHGKEHGGAEVSDKKAETKEHGGNEHGGTE